MPRPLVVLMLSASDSLLVTLLVAISNFFWLPVAGRCPTALPPVGADRHDPAGPGLPPPPALTMLANAPSF